MEIQSLKRQESSVLTEKVAQWLICCLFSKGRCESEDRGVSCTVGLFVCLFVKCILEFSDMHIQTIQVMSNNVCQELHFNFF